MPPVSSFLPLTRITTILRIINQRTHLLIALLSLEAFILSITITLVITLTSSNPLNNSLTLLILTLAATEARIGLACLVSLTRAKGKDHIPCSSPKLC